MLASFTLANFKSYEHATLPLAPLTILVGANAAGKSNLIEAMQLLAWLAGSDGWRTCRPPSSPAR